MEDNRRLVNDQGCMTQFKFDVGMCDGACGPRADRCCRPVSRTMSKQEVSYTCTNGNIVNEMVSFVKIAYYIPIYLY